MSDAESVTDRSDETDRWWNNRRELDAREPLVDNPSSAPAWLGLLLGPTVWMTHFFVVYLLAEYVCADVIYGTVSAISESSLIVIITVATAVAMAICAWAALRAAREIRSDSPSVIAMASVVLSVGSAASVLAVGLPALWIGPC